MAQKSREEEYHSKVSLWVHVGPLQMFWLVYLGVLVGLLSVGVRCHLLIHLLLGPFLPTGLSRAVFFLFFFFCTFLCYVLLISVGSLLFYENKQDEWIYGREDKRGD